MRSPPNQVVSPPDKVMSPQTKSCHLQPKSCQLQTKSCRRHKTSYVAPASPPPRKKKTFRYRQVVSTTLSHVTSKPINVTFDQVMLLPTKSCMIPLNQVMLLLIKSRHSQTKFATPKPSHVAPQTNWSPPNKVKSSQTKSGQPKPSHVTTTPCKSYHS